MDDYATLETVEGWQLAANDPVVYVDDEGETHHIQAYMVDDEVTHFTGDGYCHDHDQDCHFIVGAFEEVTIWTFQD